ncbi:GlxA family transcriptional regulator [Mesorhizobium sp. CO1-1-8]|uniref:GlxA family transcriptional regulator n=1 Tax=Mesorhizobium sp. CO1-1-8 TaxID=2876631 RepID=UPI001CD0BCE2|nr:helix-turn-helix domain-containing protein [Mesorhizobium sp. CO1-1-8]MBZ9772524.1 helix-turn-helix domain-containing protein [Mesorhizobium sp. CO1-1-8]
MSMHKVAVLALPEFTPLDFGIACDAFRLVTAASGVQAYEVQVCGCSRTVRTRGLEIRVPHGLDVFADANTIVVPGMDNPTAPISKALRAALRTASARGATITSICTGAFVLAASGLLDGKRATTHWVYAAQLGQLHPKINVEPDVLFVDEGNIVTSAGMSAGLDMCLHLIRRDQGQAVAARVARLAVAPLSRDGGQAQFIRHDPPSSPSSLSPLLDWMAKNLDGGHTVQTMAKRAGMSPRTFARRFREQTGTTPLQWLVAARVKRAQEVLEESEASLDQAALLAGFDSPVTFRARFRRVVGLTPSEYRRRFTLAIRK